MTDNAFEGIQTSFGRESGAWLRYCGDEKRGSDCRPTSTNQPSRHKRASHRRALHRRIAYRRICHGRAPHMRVAHRRVAHRRASHGPVPHGRTPHRHVLYRRVYSRSPTLQTVVRWSICRDLSCKIRVFALRDKGPYLLPYHGTPHTFGFALRVASKVLQNIKLALSSQTWNRD